MLQLERRPQVKRMTPNTANDLQRNGNEEPNIIQSINIYDQKPERKSRRVCRPIDRGYKLIESITVAGVQRRQEPLGITNLLFPQT